MDAVRTKLTEIENRYNDISDAMLKEENYSLIGEMMKISHNGDRFDGERITDELLDRLAEENADFALQSGAYGCSLPQIDEVCDMLNQTPGVLGSQIAGAGLGGCIIALVEKKHAENVIALLDEKYYKKNGYKCSASVYSASNGSSVLF